MRLFKFLAIISLISLSIQTLKSQSQDYEIDSLKNIINSNQPDPVRVTAINQLYKIIFQSEPDSAKIYLEKAEKIAMQKNDKEGLAMTYLNMGGALADEGNFEKANFYLNQAEKIAEEINYEDVIASVIGTKGYIFLGKNEYNKAKTFFIDAIEKFESLSDKTYLATNYNNLGISYENLDSLDTALKFYNKSVGILDSIGNIDLFNSYSINIAVVYKKKGDLNKALRQYDDILKSCIKVNNLNCQGILLNNKASIYFSQGKIDKALESMKESMIPFEKLNYPFRIMQVHGGLSSLYEEKKDYENSLIHIQKYLAIKDSLNNESNNRILEEMRTKYETEKKERQIEKQQVELSKKNLIKNILLTILVVIFISSLFLFYSLKTSRKNNLRLKYIIDSYKEFRENSQVIFKGFQKSLGQTNLDSEVKYDLQEVNIELKNLSSSFDYGAKLIEEYIRNGKKNQVWRVRKSLIEKIEDLESKINNLKNFENSYPDFNDFFSRYSQLSSNLKNKLINSLPNPLKTEWRRLEIILAFHIISTIIILVFIYVKGWEIMEKFTYVQNAIFVLVEIYFGIRIYRANQNHAEHSIADNKT